MANIRPLTKALEAKAIDELNENDHNLLDNIEHLRIWAEKQNNFKARTSDQFLLAFLRGCKHSIERSKEKLEKYYLLKEKLTELYESRNSDDPDVLEILKNGIILPLTKPNGDDGPIVHIIRPGLYDPNKIKFSDIIKVGTIIADIHLLENDNAVIGGLLEILDLANVSGQHLFSIDISFVKKFGRHYEDGMPIRQRGFHFMNTPSGFEGLYSIFKPLISAKNRNRVIMHGSNIESLHQYISSDILPEEYGGNCGTVKDINDYWLSKFLSYKDYFLEEHNYTMLEKPSTVTVKSCCSIPKENISELGICGTFRKLELD